MRVKLAIRLFSIMTGAGLLALSLTASASTSIMAVHSQKCVDVPDYSTLIGTHRKQVRCKINTAPTFDIIPTGSYYLIRYINSWHCFNISGNSMINGGDLIQWTCPEGGMNEQFSLIRDSSGNFSIV